MKLIELDALVAEIERRIKALHSTLNERETAVKIELKDFLSFIDTLEVKEVSFKEVKSVFEGQYLNKDKVVTTIESLQDECEEQGDNNGVKLLEKLFNKLDTLEVKEVDLEKEFCDYLEKNFRISMTGILLSNNGEPVNTIKLFDFVKHFFELGLKAKDK